MVGGGSRQWRENWSDPTFHNLLYSTGWLLHLSSVTSFPRPTYLTIVTLLCVLFPIKWVKQAYHDNKEYLYPDNWYYGFISIFIHFFLFFLLHNDNCNCKYHIKKKLFSGPSIDLLAEIGGISKRTEFSFISETVTVYTRLFRVTNKGYKGGSAGKSPPEGYCS